MAHDGREPAAELPLGVWRERPLGELAPGAVGGDAVDTQRHRLRRALWQVLRGEANLQARGSDEGLPGNRELRPLLRSRHVDAHATGRVAACVAGLRLLADPGPRPKIVVVARGQRDVDGVGDLAVAVGPE